MIDLTPLDVRNKRGDFKKIMRGYDPPEVDIFLEIVAERLEVLVRENLQLRERTQTLQAQVDAQSGREKAVQDALVTAQELRTDMQAQAQREADHILKEAEAEARQILIEAEAEGRTRLRGIERRLDQGQHQLDDLARRRDRFLKEFRGLLERELDVVSVEDTRQPMEDRAIDLDLGAGRGLSEAAAMPVAAGAMATGESSSVVEPDVAEADEAGHLTGEPSAPESATEVPLMDDGVVVEADVAPSVPAAISDAGEEPPAPLVEEPAAPPAESVRMAHDLVEEPIPEADVLAALPDVPVAIADVPVAIADAPEPVADETLAPEPIVEAQPPTPTVDVGDLSPSSTSPSPTSASPTSAPPAGAEEAPSTLELELMAGAEHAGARAAKERERFPDVPDLETVLAEAGVEEVRPPALEEIAPPPVTPTPPRDNLIFFDRDNEERKG